MPFDYRTGPGTSDDDGYNAATSIKRINNGERANQDTFRRPSENLRNRTEVIRAATDYGQVAQYFDRGLVIVPNAAVTTTGGPTCTWGGVVGGGGTGQPVLPAQVFVRSAGSPAANAIPLVQHTTTGAQTLTLSSSKWVGGIRSDRDMAEGGFNVQLEFYIGAVAEPLLATLEGSADPADGPSVIRVRLENDGFGGYVTVYNDLVTAINTAVGNTNGEVLFAQISGADANVLNGAFVTELSTRHRLYEFATYGLGGVDTLEYAVAQAGVQAVGPYAEGDVAVLDCVDIHARLEGTYNIRRIPVSGLIHTDIGSGASIPLFVISNDTLIWFNGVACAKDVPTELVSQSGLRAELANQTTVTLGDCGTLRMGGSAITGAMRTVTAGTARAQLEQLAQSDIAVTVGAANANFTTVQDAVNALAAVGGVIYIEPGTYTGAVTIGAAVPNLTFIGRDPSTTKIKVAGAAAVTIQGGQRHHFINLGLQADTAGQYIVNVNDATATANKLVQFDNCIIQRNATGVCVQTTSPCVFNHCSITGFSAASDTGIWLNDGAGTHVSNITVRDSVFSTVATGVDTAGAGGVRADFLEISNCDIVNCGNSDGAGSTSFVYLDDGILDIVLRDNRWVSGAAAVQSGSFLVDNSTLARSILIENNELQRCLSVAAPAAIHIVRISGPADYSLTTTVRGNSFSASSGAAAVACGGVYIEDMYAIVENNVIWAGQTAVTEYAIRVDVGDVSGNKITVATAAVGLYLIHLDGGTTVSSVVEKNTIDGAFDAAQYGIHTTGTAVAVVQGNAISSSVVGSTGRGIDVGANYSIVADNSIQVVKFGITCHSGNCTIRGNVILGSTAASSIGIDVSSSTYTTVTGNSVYAFEYSVDIHDTDFISVTGNTLHVRTGVGGMCIHNASGSLSNAVISNNTMEADNGIGVFFTATSSNIVVAGNRIHTHAAGVYIGNNIAVTVLLTLTNNNITSSTNNSVTVTDPGAPTELKWVVSGNLFSYTAGNYGVEFTHANNAVVAMSGNLFDGVALNALNNADTGTNGVGLGDTAVVKETSLLTGNYKW